MQVLQSFAIRAGYAVILLIAVLVLNFSMMHLAPGDVADTISQSMGGADQELLDQIRADYGLDKPFIVQLGRYIGGVLQFDLGFSFFYNQPVTDLILQRLPATLLLVVTAQLLALFIGVIMGVVSARKPNGILSHFVTFLALFGYAAPVFWTGILLLIAFSLKIQLFPVAGMQDVTIEGGFWVHFLDVARHMVLPVITLGSLFLALYSRLARATMMETLGSDFVRTAKAKGLSPNQVVYKHALKNSLSPVITLAGLQFSAVISGAVLVEAVFSWPGLGTLAFQSIIARDTPTILGILFFSALVVIVGNLLTDLALRLVDPRVGGKG
ncbi:peptide/nickel transport system permease protein [Planktotalea frisia]|jgi:peptide/nickel transport system permease protein|uniref:Dipeptide transport system permease protein DppB n=1 Tax=Planktotalea frisia TaxID=696762 RepID=A0A1L9NQZ8_9RHOB|nr:ABC transporter permease [Planktotalea frisia]OJI91661.1 dipeptide transport system permease protein DppB [Planktotalea frisia]PZX32753.1 peptide/nickel transport system permease protein [Planktotalea frisia]